MSGGFFRGTSADQDTRFSNKQAKLLKSQKFAPELEHLVDMTKVKMDIMRPWIANRVTELIGFEDEVLINFIYGLLDGKEVNGKEIQISLTGFMERNTGKFMKELWLLLLSAQKNASGVPQQFLDAKEEETKKKKAESERIANEIQRRKERESRELEQERTKKMDHGNDILKDADSVEPSSKHQRGASVSRSIEEKGSEDRNGSQGRSRGLRSRSISKSFSNSRSYSDERRRSRSVSNKQRGRSSSSDRVRRFSPRHSLSPHGRHSPRRSFSPRRRSSYSRRRSSSRSHRRSPSPTRFRMSRRSRSPLRRRSRSPTWRRPRSPTRRSSPRNRPQSAIRRRSPSLQRRSPSPIRRKSPSPSRYRPLSPLRRKYRGSPSPRRRSPPPNFRRSRSPIRRRSRSPVRRRSRSPVRRRSRSPIRRASPSPVWCKSVSPSRSRSPRRSLRPANHKSPSPREYSSASPVRRKPLSPVGRKSPKRLRRSPLQSPRGKKRSLEKLSPVHHAVERNAVECATVARLRSNSLERQSDSWDRNDSHRKLKRLSPSPHRSSVSEAERETGLNEKKSGKIHHSYSPNPPRKAKEKKLHDDSSETSADDREICIGETAKMRYNTSTKISSPDQPDRSHIERHSEDISPKRVGIQHPVQTQSRPDRTELNKKDQVLLRGDKSEKMDRNKKNGQQDSQKTRDTLLSEKRKESPVRARHRSGEKSLSHSDDTKMNDQNLENLPKLSRKVEQNDRSLPVGSDSDESDKDKAKVKNKRKNKRQELESDDESSYDSYAEERKEAKKRRKEEKKMRKEEKRRRRGERRRRKEERRAEKQKLKSVGSVSTPSDTDRRHDDQGVRRKVYRNDMEETLNEQKKLEIELREKAIELYMAKKSIGN